VPNVKKIRGLNLPGTPLGPYGYFNLKKSRDRRNFERDENKDYIRRAFKV
jgi:hypothetical protein